MATLSPEQNQKILDLRQAMMRNISQGLPPQHNIDAELIREGLAFLRQNRTPSATAAGKATATKKAAAKPKIEIDTKAFTDLDLD